MTTITITDPERASKAGAWAVENIGHKYWTMSVENLFHNPRYEFTFNRKKDAMRFALQWV